MYHHVPVLIREVLSVSGGLPPSGSFLDLTLGGGSYSEALLESLPTTIRGIGFDRDLEAIEAAGKRVERFGDRMRLVHSQFSAMLQHLRPEDHPVVFVVADLGVSSHHLDEARRGFSLMQEGPLDMRMDQSSGETAEGMIRRLSVAELADILARYGEVPKAREIATRIRDGVLSGGIATTVQLADMVRFGFGRGKTGIVAQVFQALRIAVNGELDELETLLKQGPELLAVGGRLAIVTFHSLEDRAVKDAFRRCVASGAFQSVTARASAKEDEVAGNVRARTGTLRCIERVA